MKDISDIAAAPHSIEAEQQVLGALLLAPDTFASLAATIGKDAFYEPAHARLFSRIGQMQRDGKMVSPVALKDWAQNDPAIMDLGGAAYLVRLAGYSLGARSAPGYAEIIAEKKRQRDLIDMLRDALDEVSAGETPTDDVAARVEARLSLREAKGADGTVSMMKATTDALAAAHAAYHGEETPGVQTGIAGLDRVLTKLQPGQLIVLGGRPSMGKSGLALSIALNIARAGGGVAFSTLEMTPQAMAERALAESTGQLGSAVSYFSMERGQMSETQMRSLADAAKLVSVLPIEFLPSHLRDPASIFAGVKRLKKRFDATCGLRLLVVDYLQLMSAEGRSNVEKVTEISKQLKALAMQLQVPVLALSQLSRAVETREDKRPMLSDLRESGQIEQDADAVLFCYRDEYYLEREEPKNAKNPQVHEEWERTLNASKNRMEVIVAKQRRGPIGTVKVRFNPAINLVWED